MVKKHTLIDFKNDLFWIVENPRLHVVNEIYEKYKDLIKDEN